MDKLTLEKYAQELESDPEYIAEGFALKIIEEALKTLKDRKLNKTWLAKRMGVSRYQLSKIFDAPPSMTFLTFANIAVALDLKPVICFKPKGEADGNES